MSRSEGIELQYQKMLEASHLNAAVMVATGADGIIGHSQVGLVLGIDIEFEPFADQLVSIETSIRLNFLDFSKVREVCCAYIEIGIVGCLGVLGMFWGVDCVQVNSYAANIDQPFRKLFG